MIPSTKNGLPALVCISALQKSIRRGDERAAMEFAVELMHSGKSLASMALNRLEVISHEDVDTETQPWIVPFVATAVEQAKRWYEEPNPGKSRMAAGNAIRMLCRAKKSREGDHFQAAVGLQNLLNGFVPTVPDHAYDQHTRKGKAMGRGLEHFRTEGAKLENKVSRARDPYENEAYEMWVLRNKTKAKSKPRRDDGPGLFDGE